MSKIIKEEELTASSYIITFYKEVGLLTHASALYQEVLTELETKHGKDIDQIEEQDDHKLREAVATVRYHAYKINIQYKGIQSTIKSDDKLITLYQQLTKSYVIKSENLEAFVVEANNFLTTKIMRSLLESSNQLIEGIYGTNT